MTYRLVQNKFVVGIAIVVSIILCGLGIGIYLTNEPLDQNDLIAYSGTVQNVKVSARDDKTDSFTFGLSGYDKNFSI